MVISFLAPYANLNFIMSIVPRRFQKVLRKQLALLIEVVPGALQCRQ